MSSSTGLGDNFTQVSDINASNTSAWNGGKGFIPIGENGTEFTGAFVGNGFNITGLYINRGRSTSDGTGLFGRTGSAAFVGDVFLEDADVNNPSNGFVGALIGYHGGSVDLSYSTGTVSGDGDLVGGLVGLNDGGTVERSYATGNVSGNFVVGGLVGSNDGGTVRSSYAIGDVSGTKNLGGLVGRNNFGTVGSSYATGDVSGTFLNVGGLVGDNQGEVNESYATGSVSGFRGVGGLVGENSAGGIVDSSYATGTVSGDDDNVGGLVGFNDGSITSSYATPNVSGSGNYVGGFVGNNTGAVADGYWDVNTTNQTTSEGGTGLTTDEMTGGDAPANMDGFDFVGTWFATEEYPVLTWQGAGPLFAVNVTGTNSPINETEKLKVTTNVTNYGSDGTQTVNLTDTEFENTERDSVSVTLTSGESNGSVRLEWPTQEGENGTGNVTVASENTTDTANVTVRELAFFDVNITGTNSPVNETETLNVTANVTNTGGVQGTQEIELNDTEFNNQAQDNVTLTLAPGESQNRTLSWSTVKGDNGTGNVTVASENTTDTANVTVRAFASFDVNVTGTNLPVKENEVAEVEVNVTNDGDLPGTETVKLMVDAEVVDNETLTLGPGESSSITLKWQTESGDGGSGSISVAGENDVEVLSIEVGELLDKRDVGRGELNQRREGSRDMGRGELGERDDLFRDSGRNTNSNRRDRGR